MSVSSLRTSFPLVLVIWLLASSGGAATIATWDIAGADGAPAAVAGTAPNTTAIQLTSSGVTDWSGVLCCIVAASDWGTSAVAPDLTRYFTFSVAADAGFSIVYQTLTLSLFRGVFITHGAEQWQLRSSVDGFAAAVASFDLSASAPDEQVLFSGVDISSVGTQTGTVEFRLYGYDYTNLTDNSGLGNNGALPGTGSDVILGGLVVPEPSTGALVLVGLGALAVIRRRHA
jgi:hypothetical protein